MSTDGGEPPQQADADSGGQAAPAFAAWRPASDCSTHRLSLFGASFPPARSSLSAADLDAAQPPLQHLPSLPSLKSWLPAAGGSLGPFEGFPLNSGPAAEAPSQAVVDPMRRSAASTAVNAAAANTVASGAGFVSPVDGDAGAAPVLLARARESPEPRVIQPPGSQPASEWVGLPEDAPESTAASGEAVAEPFSTGLLPGIPNHVGASGPAPPMAVEAKESKEGWSMRPSGSVMGPFNEDGVPGGALAGGGEGAPMRSPDLRKPAGGEGLVEEEEGGEMEEGDPEAAAELALLLEVGGPRVGEAAALKRSWEDWLAPAESPAPTPTPATGQSGRR